MPSKTPTQYAPCLNWRSTFYLGLVAVLSGCQARQAARISVPSPTATPIPTARPTPRPNRKPKRRVTGTILSEVRTRSKVFALTFDDGPDPTWTPRILAILQKRRVPATFFMVGEMVHAHPRWAREVGKKHPVGSHSWSHPLSTRSPVSEIERTNATLKKVMHTQPTLFRPPYGVLHNGLAKAALAHNMHVVVWSSHGADWDKKATADTITRKVLRSATPGGIALLHDGGGNRSQTVAALPCIIEGLRRRGYRFVTIPHLLTMGSALHNPVLPSPKTRVRSKKKNAMPKGVTKSLERGKLRTDSF